MKKTILCVGLSLAAISCAPDVRSVDVDIEPVFTPFDDIPDQCTDAKLALWFDLFHRYQEEGFGMFQADEKARKQVELDLAACGQDQINALGEKKSARK